MLIFFLFFSQIILIKKYWYTEDKFSLFLWGWLGGGKVSCILRHRGVQLILAYSLARPVILVVGKGRGGMFLFLPFHSCSSFFPLPLFHLFYYFFYLFSPCPWETTQNDTRLVVKPQHNQSLFLHQTYFTSTHWYQAIIVSAPQGVFWCKKKKSPPIASYSIVSSIVLTHCRLNELPHTINWKILISILGMSGYVI